jgi:hypothetical protein
VYFLRSDYFQFDSEVSPASPLHERLALDLRLEALHVLNHPAIKLVAGVIDLGQMTSTLSN